MHCKKIGLEGVLNMIHYAFTVIFAGPKKKVSSFLKKGGEREKTKILEDYVDDNVTLSVTSFKSNTLGYSANLWADLVFHDPCLSSLSREKRSSGY